ncbi:MAG: aldo/keto reductase [Parvularculaceae bacterium]
MEKRPLGRSGVKVSALCLGTMMYGDQIPEADAAAQMDACFDRGVDFFDTAEMYTIPPKPETQGESERIVGRWLAARGRRDKVVVATKVVGRSRFSWIRDGEETRLTRAQIEAAVDRSLTNLQTDYIDLYQLHWPDRPAAIFGAAREHYRHPDDEGVPLEETLGALGDLVAAGKIRHVGLSNETAWGTMACVGLAETLGLPRIQSIQNAYNLLNRTFEIDLAEIAMREEVGLLAYSPIAQGVLTGKYLGGARPAGSRGQLYDRLSRYETPGAEAAVKAYAALARDVGVDPAALAMQFVTTRAFVASNIFGARTPEQLETIFASLELKWTRELDEAVTAIHSLNANPCP